MLNRLSTTVNWHPGGKSHCPLSAATKFPDTDGVRLSAWHKLLNANHGCKSGFIQPLAVAIQPECD